MVFFLKICYFYAPCLPMQTLRDPLVFTFLWWLEKMRNVVLLPLSLNIEKEILNFIFYICIANMHSSSGPLAGIDAIKVAILEVGMRYAMLCTALPSLFLWLNDEPLSNKSNSLTGTSSSSPKLHPVAISIFYSIPIHSK